MLVTIFLCSIISLLGFLLCRKQKSIKGNNLPGPTSLPLLGNLLQIGFRPHVTFTKWTKCYGPIYRVKLGVDEAIIVSDYKLIKELFNETGTAVRLSGNPVMLEFTKGPYGVINSKGSTWESQRKLTVRALRNLGFGKASMETIILDEVKTILDWLGNQDGSPTSGVRIFNAPVISTIWRAVTGERCEWEDCKPPILEVMDEFFKASMAVSTNGLFFAPVLRFIAPGLLGWNRYVKAINNAIRLFQESIEKHQKTFNSEELRDYIDYHLFEIDNEKDPNSCFYKNVGIANMTAAMFDMFFAGSETTSATLSWMLLYLSHHQEIQKKFQKEIDTVVGSHLPSLSDRLNMPYSEALMSEILRISSVAPCGVPHGIESDLSFHGYQLPKGATVFANLYAVHNSPDIWGDPTSFRPERFLTDDGTMYLQNEALIPFSEGKRKCIGEAFAKDTIFLFVTSICQQFTVLPGNTEKSDFKADFGLLLAPKPFNIVFLSRKR